MTQATEDRFAPPDDVRAYPPGRAEVLTMAGADVGRLVLEPGGKWSNEVRPVAGTDVT